jgi:hypothetical protein
MLGAGTVINPIIKIVTVVAVLAATYFFIVKPVLDTTNDAFDAFDVNGISDSLQSELDDAFDSTGDSQRLEECIKRATRNGVDSDAIQRCIDRFGS